MYKKKKRKVIDLFRRILIYMIIPVVIYACGTIRRSEEQKVSLQNEAEQITEEDEGPKSLEIFSIPNAQINKEIHQLLLSDVESYYKFMDRSRRLTLTCDTLDGRIIDITPKNNADFGIYKTRLIDYFKSFTYVNCASYPKSGKVNEYSLLFLLSSDSLYFEVGYGYEDFER